MTWKPTEDTNHLTQKPLDPGSTPGAAMLDGSFILATSAVHIITMKVPTGLLGLTQVKVILNSLIHTIR